MQNAQATDPSIVGIKQLHIDLKSIPERIENGEEFIVVKNSKPVFKIVSLQASQQSAKKKFVPLDFSDIQFSSNDKDLSKNIDKILYG